MINIFNVFVVYVKIKLNCRLTVDWSQAWSPETISDPFWKIASPIAG